MSKKENNPYYYGVGKYKGESATIYYDYNNSTWDVELSKNGEYISDVNLSDIEI